MAIAKRDARSSSTGGFLVVHALLRGVAAREPPVLRSVIEPALQRQAAPTMSSDRRLAALARHLSLGQRESDQQDGLARAPTSAATPCPDQLFRFLCRDNQQLRKSIFDFLKVRLAWMHEERAPCA